jgi:hypothetical protein
VLPAAGAGAADLSYRNVFRVLIMQFIDAMSFDLRAVKKSCVHIAQPTARSCRSTRSTCSIATNAASA